MKEFIVGRIKSFKYAFRGMFILITTEHSLITQLSIFCIFIILGIYFNITSQEWINQIIVFGFVFAIEGLNTAIEDIADFVHPERHKQIGKIKDIAAGAVTFAAITTFIVLCIIYYPYLFK